MNRHRHASKEPRPLYEYLKQQKALSEELREESAKAGVGVGEMVKSLTDYLGISQCPRCRRWQAWLDQIRLRDGKIEWNEVARRATGKTAKVIKVEWFDVN